MAVERPAPHEFGHVTSPDAMAELNMQVIREAAGMIPVQWDGATVLDVACGQRQYVVDHLWSGARVRVGADISFEAAAANSGVNAACADMYALPFRTASCDIVVSLDTIEHAATPERFLTEVGRVLRPGGSAIIITPNLLGYHAMIAKMIGNFGAEIVWRVLKGRSLPYDLYYRANTIRRLRAIGSERGLEVESVVYVPYVQHFFWPYAPLRRFFMHYHHAVTRLGMPWLLPNMIVHMRRADAEPILQNG
ncbi:MAG TPA: methyltransferase domain-containing protein [Longimicrobiales bacterium]|nr:methyltransferase domain-containing protein [Longimicrobiales bacterium]